MKIRKSYRGRMFGLIIVLITVSVMVMLFTLFTLFRSVAYQNQYILSSYVDNQALLFERMLLEQPDWQIEEPLTVMRRVYSQFDRQTLPLNETTGVFEVIVQTDDEIHWLMGGGTVVSSAAYLLEDKVTLAALNGAQGVVVLDDGFTEPQVKAFSGLPEWGVAFILTVSMNELREPFVNAAIRAVLAAIILTSIGGWFFYRISRPIIVDLEENELKYRTLFDNANEGVLLLSPEIVDCNDRAAMIFGLTKWELLGRSLDSFSVKNQAYQQPRDFISRAENGEAQYFLWLVRDSRGSEHELEVMMRKVELDEQDRLLVTLVDITDRRRAEKDLRVAEKAIRDGRDHLAHVARLNTMGEMAAGIAHEINQPLSAITTYAQASEKLLQRPELDREMMEEAFTQIAKQARRAGEVIRRLRDFVNKSGTNLQLWAPEDIVAESVALGMVDARKYDIPVVTDLQVGIAPIQVDAVQIQQVLINLIRNALEAVAAFRQSDGQVDVILSAEERGVIIQIGDNGPGLSDEALQRVFHPFFTTKASGMGIGLSISHSIVQAHKGTMRVFNKDEGGAVFEVCLPYAKTSA